MEMRTVLPAGIAVGLIVVLAGAVVLAGPASADTPDVDAANATSISVSASASSTAAPDRALVSVAVVERAESADDARQQLATAVATLREELTAAGIDEDAIETTGYRLQMDYAYHDGDREPRGYVATQSFEIESPAVDRAGEVVDAAVAGGANRIDGVQFSLSDERRQELRATVLADAMDRARADADAIAGAANLNVTGVDTVSTGNVGYVPMFYDAAERAGDGTVIDPGPVTVSASVSVTYLAE